LTLAPWILLHPADLLHESPVILLGIDPRRSGFDRPDPDLTPCLEQAQLFQSLLLLQNSSREVAEALQSLVPEAVDPDVLQPTLLWDLSICGFRHRRPGESQRPSSAIGDHLDPVRIPEIWLGIPARSAHRQCRHATIRVILEQFDQHLHMVRIQLRFIPLDVDDQVISR
jgi:hypothetical protein